MSCPSTTSHSPFIVLFALLTKCASCSAFDILWTINKATARSGTIPYYSTSYFPLCFFAVHMTNLPYKCRGAVVLEVVPGVAVARVTWVEIVAVVTAVAVVVVAVAVVVVAVVVVAVVVAAGSSRSRRSGSRSRSRSRNSRDSRSRSSRDSRSRSSLMVVSAFWFPCAHFFLGFGRPAVSVGHTSFVVE
jgi:hypothetical protein